MRWLALDLDRLRSVMVTPAVVDCETSTRRRSWSVRAWLTPASRKARMILRGVSRAKHGADN